MEKFTQKILMNRVAFSARIVVVGMILSAVFFLLFVDLSKTYRSEISIMINAKSEVAAKQQLQIVSNIVEFPKTLAFYDRLLKLNHDVRDVAVGFSPQKRKAAWNQMLSVEKVSYDASVIKIAVTTSRESDSVQLVGMTARTLFDTSAFYYNIKNDVDLRIVDGPITRVQVSAWFWLFLLSILLGFFVSWLLQKLIFSDNMISLSRPDFLKMKNYFDFKKNSAMPVEEELESLNNLYQNSQFEESFVFEQKSENNIAPAINNADEKFQEIKKITKQFEPAKYPNFSEMPTSFAKEAGAPDNLPIADDSFFAQYSAPTEPAEIEQSSQAEEPFVINTTTEPTPEDLKRRLNELLRGKI